MAQRPYDVSLNGRWDIPSQFACLTVASADPLRMRSPTVVDGRPFSFAYQSNTLGSTALGLLKTRGNQMAGTTAI